MSTKIVHARADVLGLCARMGIDQPDHTVDIRSMAELHTHIQNLTLAAKAGLRLAQALETEARDTPEHPTWLDTSEIRARLDIASPGPWTAVTDGDSGDMYVKIAADGEHDVYVGNMEGACGTCCANHELIAHAPADIKALLDELDRRDAALKGRTWPRP